MEKICANCQLPKLDSEFSPRQNKCKSCTAMLAKARRDRNIDAGLCACGQPPAPDQKMCARCCAENRRRYGATRSYTKRTGNRYGPTDVKKRPGRWAEVVAERVCKTCGVLKAIEEFPQQNYTRNEGRTTHRHSCKSCESQKTMQRMAAAKLNGKCMRCNAAVSTAGYSTCGDCRATQARARQNSYDALRALVLVKYGRQCANCADNRIECLEIDHVGGWGKDHVDRKGQRLRGVRSLEMDSRQWIPRFHSPTVRKLSHLTQLQRDHAETQHANCR